MRLVVADEAKADLERIADHIAADNPKAALRLVARFRSRFREIRERPYASAFVPGFEEQQIRRKIEGNYLIFYRVGTGRIEVIHILHGAMRYEAILGRPE